MFLFTFAKNKLMEYFSTFSSIPVHINDSESGDVPVIFLHGYLETMYIWDDFLELLDPRFRTVAMDLPGHGLSGSFELNTMDRMADAVCAVLDKCGIDSAFAVGHSMGGYVALEFARKYADRCRGVVLLNSSPYADTESKAEDRKREIEIIKADRLLCLAMSSVPKMYDPDNLRDLDDKIQETIENCETHDPDGIISCINGMVLRKDLTDHFRNYDKPLVMVFGRNDRFMPEKSVADLILKLPNADSYILDHTGHSSFVEAPVETADIINSALLNI